MRNRKTHHAVFDDHVAQEASVFTISSERMNALVADQCVKRCNVPFMLRSEKSILPQVERCIAPAVRHGIARFRGNRLHGFAVQMLEKAAQMAEAIWKAAR